MDKGGSLFECRKAGCSFASEKLAHVFEHITRGNPEGIEEIRKGEGKSILDGRNPYLGIIDYDDWSRSAVTMNRCSGVADALFGQRVTEAARKT